MATRRTAGKAQSARMRMRHVRGKKKKGRGRWTPPGMKNIATCRLSVGAFGEGLAWLGADLLKDGGLQLRGEGRVGLDRLLCRFATLTHQLAVESDPRALL